MVYVLLVTSPVSVVLLLLWIAAQTVHHIVMLVYQLQPLHTDKLIFSHSDHSHITCRYELFTSLAVYRCIMSVTYCSLHHSTCILSERKSEITAISCLIKHIHTQQYRTYLCRTYTHLMAFFPGLPGWAGTRKVKPIWILLKQETVSGSDISWDICKSASRSTQITMPVPHHSSFLQTGCPSCRPTNSVKALKGKKQ